MYTLEPVLFAYLATKPISTKSPTLLEARNIKGSDTINDLTFINVVFPETNKLPETSRLPETETLPYIVPPLEENLVLAKSYAELAVMNAPLA